MLRKRKRVRDDAHDRLIQRVCSMQRKREHVDAQPHTPRRKRAHHATRGATQADKTARNDSMERDTRIRNAQTLERWAVADELTAREHQRIRTHDLPQAQVYASYFRGLVQNTVDLTKYPARVRAGYRRSEETLATFRELGTWRNYYYAIKKFAEFVRTVQPEAPVLPSDRIVLRAFLAEYADTTKSTDSVSTMCSAITHAHVVNDLEHDHIAAIFKRARASAARRFGRPRKQKIPFTARQIEWIMEEWGGSNCPAKRMVALYMAISFAATLRHSDAMLVCERGTTKAGTEGKDRLLCLVKAKNDPTFKGDSRPLPARRDVPAGDLRCPVTLFEAVCARGLGGRGADRLFVNIKSHRFGKRKAFLDFTTPLQYATAVRWVKKAFISCPGVSAKDATLAATHCCRIGSRNANSRHANQGNGLNAEAIDATGNWASSRSSAGYDNADTRLAALVANPVWN